ncbi:MULTISPECIES: glycine--tRNA ligase subunit beta [unclassified Sphingomonas]|uniref:glycine--tRNA ligase subunit beta n=1 Tax=unclassified Sphingomonas TaxID=196159 RepID=UPI00285EEC11|nr:MULTISPECIES: glycine--tRNA ligase subunit beta [unclassified Sphingomonas]MDR6113508.1 glycyl-tRNA synthetase beta chain [Sphingomonas sp. SORGH_AS_0789]MDR6149131.1 glycyl-tRNA synthetase beta chain [Sphingomonas sp. SORGH_AS_0742]
MTDFLLELRSEEIPARMQAGARENLAKLFAAELAKAGLSAGEIVTYAGPRRLALIAKGLPSATEAVSEEVKGPRASAPPQALEGFLRKTGLTREQLTERDGVLFAITEKPGRATAQVLAEAIPAIVRAFPWPKSMRWGAESASTESMRWVRPLHAIVALFGGEVVPFEVAGITSGNVTRGHRFHAPAEIVLTGADTYVEQLRGAKVLVDQDERAAIIRKRASALAAEAGLELVEDEGLVAENAGLTEWPVPLLGRFDEAYLDVPPEVIQLTARVNQKYFVCRSGDGKLANAFVCTANIEASDGGAKIVEGNGKVLAARLSDARFFYETDLKTKLDDLRPKLEKIVFHERLGSVADKVERVAKLARWLVEEGIVTESPSRRREGLGEGRAPSDVASGTAPPPSPPVNGGGELADLAERAAYLAKADLVTGMVGEFPELQGLMGGYYAAAQGEDPRVAEAVRDHYKPVGQGDDVPTAPVTVAVALAERLHTLAAFFEAGIEPTGSKDPFALRRAALGTLQLILTNGLRFRLRRVFEIVLANNRYGQTYLTEEPTLGKLLDFFADRLKVQQREAGVRHDLIDAVFALGGEDDLVRLLARVRALQAFVTTDDGTNLLAGYKRAANILKKEGVEGDQGWTAPTYTPEPAEADLIAALDAAEPKAAEAVKAEDFEAAMAALASLRAPIDRFFDDVTVNDADPAKRAVRLALLARVRAAVHMVADFSRIEG